MIPPQESHHEVVYRPQAAETLRQTLIRFIPREFPRLRPSVVGVFVDKVLELVDTHRIEQEPLNPGQAVCQAVALDEPPRRDNPTI